MAKINQGAQYIVNDCQTKFTLPKGYQFTKFSLLTDCKFSIMEPMPGQALAGFLEISIPAGVDIIANVESFKLNSGSLIAYYGVAVVEKVQTS